MQRYFCDVKNENKFLLSSDDKYHILTVMRMQTGGKIEVVYNQEVYICEIDLTNGFEVNIFEKKEALKEEKTKKTLIVPLLKEQKMDLILQKSTELGVDEIIPVVMERSVVKLDSKKEEKRIERWSRICKEAAEQSKRINIPIVTEVKRITDLNDLGGLNLVCSTIEKDMTIKKFLTLNRNYDRINIVMGPEGGLSPNEEDLLVKIGFNRVSLGNRIMRVETVPLFIMSILNYENME